MEQRKKQHTVYLTDEEYADCVRICGKGNFSAWSSEILLSLARKNRLPEGSLAGGVCARPDCKNVGAWIFNTVAQEYLCEPCAASSPVDKRLLRDARPQRVLGDREALIQKLLDASKALSEYDRAYGGLSNIDGDT